MATYTVTTGTPGAPVDYAALGTRANGDIFNLNGGYLLVDCDTRYGLGGAAAAAFGNIVGSASLGGTIEINSTKVRLIPYASGTGNVPAADTVIGTAGGASGKLIAVYSAINAAPTAAAAAMPATGFIKVRAWNSTTYATSTALTGIAATTSAVDGPGFLEIVGLDASTATINRLNEFYAYGDYYTFQGITTTGVVAGAYQLPTNGGAVVYCPGVEVETGVGTGIYDFYPCAGSKTALLASVATDEVRGKWCWIIAGTGMVRFGSDGTNSTGGFIPPAGRKIRVPNIFFTCCIAAAVANILPSATLSTRYEFATTGGGVIVMDKVSCNWYLNFAQAFSIALTNVNTFESITLTECASPIAWSNVGIGQTAANTQIAITMGLNFAGGTMNKCTWTRAAQAASGAYISSWADCSGFTVTNERNHSLTKAANATTGTCTLTRVANSTWANTILGGGRVFETTCTNVTFTNSVYYDNPATTTATAIPMFAFDIAANCLSCKFDGLSWGGLTLVQPYSGILNIGAAGCTDIKLRNLGTNAAPLDMGSAQVDGTYTQVTTTASITKAAHGLKVGDIIYVLISSNTAIITVGTKTVAAITSVNIFTFTCVTGSTTGTITYYPTMAYNLVAIATGGAANRVKIQRCYVPHLRSVLLTGDNSSKNITLESVQGDLTQGTLVPELNAVMKQIGVTPTLAAQTSVYGTHFFDFFTADGDVSSATAWARATTVATVTKTAHGLRTGNLLNVTVTSDAAAIVLGQKTITVLTSSTFTFTCLNAGGATGTITYKPLNSYIAIQMNETTADTSAQVTLTNGSAFTSAGGLYMPVIGHQADFTAPANFIGYTEFPIALPSMAGGGTIGNFDITYSVNNGTTYHNLYYPRPGGAGSAAASTFTVTSGTGIEIGDYVWGTGIAPNAKVTNIATNTVTVDIVNTATVSGAIIFNHLPSEVIADASVGFALKVRIKTSATNSTAITSLYAYALSTPTSRGYTYPLDTITLTLTGLVTGSDIVVLAAGTSTERVNVDANGSTSYNYVYATTESVDIGIFKAGYVPKYVRNYPLGSSDASLPIVQVLDRNYF